MLSKAIIAPIIALALLLLKRIFNLEFAQPEIDVLIDGVLALAALIGILINPKKEEPTK